MENKNKYENVIIITGGFTQEEYKKSLKNITEKIKNIIDIEKIEEIGKKKLAYEVKKNTEGWYVVIYFKAINQNILELERFYRINEDIIKFITVKIDD